MNNTSLSVQLNTTQEQLQRLVALQLEFSNVCNVLAPVVRDTRCWNRVALHHMAYRKLREQFPEIGSQMVCNAIYSVARICRLVFQSPESPFNIQRMGNKALPLVRFLPSAPVYFDRHTLSLRQGTLSMFTLDGRLHFELNLSEVDTLRFKQQKLIETVLNLRGEHYFLSFSFGGDDLRGVTAEQPKDMQKAGADWPEYIEMDSAPKLVPINLAPGGINTLESIYSGVRS